MPLQPKLGDILAYYASDNLLAFKGIAIGEYLADHEWPKYVHVGMYAGPNKQITTNTDWGINVYPIWPMPYAILRPKWSYGSLASALTYAYDRQGEKPYGWADVFLSGIATAAHARKFGWPMSLGRKLPPDCAGLIAKMCKYGGLNLFPDIRFSWEVIPDDFKNAQFVEIIR